YVRGETYPKYNITVVSAKCADSGLIPCDVDKVQCFHNKSRCNSVPDCDNGRDESPEFCECRGNQFRCNITHCINILSRCDGRRDCADGRDEENC
ncbi:G-protein coupled receptor GRL101, partial [Biomphalaria pfeifferi]